MTNEPDIYGMVRKLRYDLTAMQAKVSDILEELSRLNLPAQTTNWKCKHCGIEKRTEELLNAHIELIHHEYTHSNAPTLVALQLPADDDEDTDRDEGADRD